MVFKTLCGFSIFCSDSNEKDWDPYNRKALSNFLGLTTEMLPYNLIPTTILCSKEKPAINIRTGEEFTENDPPLEVATEKEIIREKTEINIILIKFFIIIISFQINIIFIYY